MHVRDAPDAIVGHGSLEPCGTLGCYPLLLAHHQHSYARARGGLYLSYL